MTQKHFIAIAQLLCDSKARWVTQFGIDAYNELVGFQIGVCAANGRNFDVDTFRSYLSKHGG